ncbi:MAG TPA: FAD-binding oxidoreductase [Solirubrobacteraceae bacterium]|jgi:glycine/D-amino acid oxidase-like deaminating enzyme|nr:FAD-binding oxidoreductase [Solirubrobacteraceae bacterium]
MRTGELGFWWRSLEGPPPLRPALEGPLEVDVAIVGAGYTGLWTAYYLKRADPSLSIAIVEAQRSGFGASGRNGGWLTSSFSGPAQTYERRRAGGAYLQLQRAMFDTIDEVAAVLASEQIEADFVRGGHLSVALDHAQAEHLTDHVREMRSLGVGEADLSELRAEELAVRMRIAGARAAIFSPHAARIHPAKLVAGLAQAVERLGVTIYEQTPVREIERHVARTHSGDVRARWIVRATEGYTRSLRGMRRELAPINSSMIVTEPLGADVWQEIGWRGCEVLDDGAHVFVYLQRTADGRIAIGGRGVPYRFASRTDGEGATAAATVDSLRAKLHAMFPATAGASIDHAWSGVLGVTRDWCVSIGADTDADGGLAWAGGYAGEGVAAANLAGRIIRDLLLDGRSPDDDSTPLSELAWVGHRARSWEPEPLRWAGIRGVYSLYRQADRIERRVGRASRLGRLVDAVSGRG